MRDEGKSVKTLNGDDSTIETALRLSKNKFGRVLHVEGSDDFKRKAALVAAEKGFNITFLDKGMNEVMNAHKEYLKHLRENDAASWKAGREFERQQRPERKQEKPVKPVPDRPAPAMASTEPNTQAGQYTGKVVAVDAWHVYQDITQNGSEIVRHERKHFEEMPPVGDEVQIRYQQGQASLRNLSHELAQERSGPER